MFDRFSIMICYSKTYFVRRLNRKDPKDAEILQRIYLINSYLLYNCRTFQFYKKMAIYFQIIKDLEY